MAEFPQIEGYRIVEEIAAGSVSIVYKALQEPLGRTVALKILRGTVSATSAFAAQLEREAKLLSELSHPGIALLYDFVKTRSRMHLVLEFVDGFSLSAVLEKRVALPPDAVAAIGIEAARALSYAHARGVIHRDIKPKVILISRLGEVKIVDFGLARARSDAETPLVSPPHGESASFETPSYMSPERLLGEKMEPRSDIFSLGVILYELIAGMRPFERGGDSQRRSSNIRLRREPAIALHKRAPHVPRALERVIMQAVERNPSNRPDSAAAFADALERAVTFPNEPRGTTVARVLDSAGFTDSAAALAPRPQTSGAAPHPLRVVFGLLGALAFFIVGGTVIQGTAPHYAHPFIGGPLELSPANAGALRVLVSPWAEVSVDGQKVDTTPMARAIPLNPGTHYVTLHHPQSTDEKREVNVVAGQTQTLSVVMNLGETEPPATSSSTKAREEMKGSP